MVRKKAVDAPAPAAPDPLTQAKSTGQADLSRSTNGQALSRDKITSPSTPVVGPDKETVPASPSVGAWVDELGAIDKELAPYAGKIKRAEILRKAVRERVPNNPPDKTYEFAGERFVAYVGARGNQTAVKWAELVKRIGAAKFATFATASLETLKKHVAAGHLSYCLSLEQTGPRTLKVVEKGRAE